jgi:response regulator RpfG family c-di-GMP phosphodiesterase
MALPEPLAKSGETPITLSRHLQEVVDYARAVAQSYKQHWENLLGTELAEQVAKALVLSALTHDFGKIAEGFNARYWSENSDGNSATKCFQQPY